MNRKNSKTKMNLKINWIVAGSKPLKVPLSSIRKQEIIRNIPKNKQKNKLATKEIPNRKKLKRQSRNGQSMNGLRRKRSINDIYSVSLLLYL